METLRNATLPAFPISPLVCDGEYVELRVCGTYANLTLGWWTIAPDGAEAYADFAAWLRDVGAQADPTVRSNSAPDSDRNG